jgi:hypothetical protein
MLGSMGGASTKLHSVQESLHYLEAHLRRVFIDAGTIWNIYDDVDILLKFDGSREL